MSDRPPVEAPDGPGDLPPPVQRRMALVLRVGLAVALVLLAAGILALTIRSARSPASAWTSPNPLIQFFDLRAFGRALTSGDPEAYLTLGVYALVATPVVRVVAGIEAFAHHGERRMAVLASTVLAMLLVGLFVVGPLVR